MATPLLKQLFFERNLKQSQVAKMMGVSDALMSKWVLGKSYPDPDNLYKLAKILGVRIEDLYKFKE